LVLKTPQEAYLASGKFHRDAMLKLLDDAMHAALSQGFTGFRGTGDLSWAARDTDVCGQLPEYEAMLDRYYPGTRSLGICMYDRGVFSAKQAEALLHQHRLAILQHSEGKRAIRIRKGHVFGDVLFDPILPSSIFHFVVQEDGSSKVWLSGQDFSLAGAIAAVESALSDWPG
jgi:hypothetical protein